jgi:hypothetical protein
MVTRTFLLSILAVLIAGAFGRLGAAAEALGAPPIRPAARRLRSMALGFLMASSGLLLAAALAETIAGARSLSETLGWGGIGCLLLCVPCSLHYASVNKKRTENEWDLA